MLKGRLNVDTLEYTTNIAVERGVLLGNQVTRTHLLTLATIARCWPSVSPAITLEDSFLIYGLVVRL